MNAIWNDIRFAIRTLRKSPIFTIVAVLSLALGIGANTAIFTLLDQVLLRLLPVKSPRELVMLGGNGPTHGSNWGRNSFSHPMYLDLAANNQVFSGLMCRFPTSLSLSFGGQTERVRAELVSGTYFQVLGVQAAVGRLLTPNDDRVPNGHPIAVLSYSYWKTRFGGDPDIAGREVTVNGHNMTVIGVAQRGFDGVELEHQSQVFVPVMMKAEMTPGWDDMKNRRAHWLNVFGRLKPGVSEARAQASLQPFFHSVLEMEVKEAAFNDASESTRQKFLKSVLLVLPGGQGRSEARQVLSSPLWVLMAITAGVLLIACANVANLLIARAGARQKEMAVRLSLGATRGRIIMQLLIESLLLAVLGGLAGTLMAVWTDASLMQLLPSDTLSLKLSSTPDLRILLFTVGVSLVTGILFGLLPALQATRPDVAPTLKDQAGAVVGGGSQVGIRKGLVAAQVTLSLLLLIGAGLFVRSLQNLRDLGPGFPADNLIAFNVDPSLNGYDDAKTKSFYRRLHEGLAGLPGVKAAGLASMRILTRDEWTSSVTVEGYRAKNEDVQAAMNGISPGYFEALGVPLLAGRDFRANDTERIKHGPDKDDFVPRVVIINEKFAKKFFADPRPLGRHVGFGNDPNTKIDMEVIGVVKDIKYASLRDETPVQMFVPYMADEHTGQMTVYVRSALDANQMFAAVRAEVRQMDPNLPLYGMRTLDEQISSSLLIERLIASLSSVFGLLATLLATIGLYGVMAYTVSRRTREIGIRVALGALGGDVVWLVMREVLVLVGIGVVAGFGAAMVLTRFVQSQLFGVSSLDPLTLVAATIGLAAIACLAGYLPAFRASRIDATRALRYE
jgi:predicted permease